MSRKVINLDLAEKLSPLWGVEDYEEVCALVRYQEQPVGWVKLPGHGQSIISSEQLIGAINQQLGWQLVLAILGKQFGKRVGDIPPLPPVSIVICTRDRADLLSGCLRALQAIDYPCYEVIVVDNASSNDETAKLVASLSVRYVREERPGLDWARNRGIAESRHSIIAFIDDDARPDRNWLRAISTAFINSEVMAVTGLVGPAELETAAQNVFEFGYGGMGKGFRRRTFRLGNITKQELLWAHMFGVGTNMAFRREVFTSIGNFDVALDIGTPSGGGGDLDMFHRVIAKGYTLVYEPAALVWHVHRRSALALRRQFFDNGRGFGSYLFTCLRNRTISRISVLHFAIWDWLGWALLGRLLRPRGFPRHMVMAELLGALRSPIAYMAAQAHARKTATRFRTEPKDRTVNLSVRLDPKPDSEEFVSIRPPEALVSVQAFIERLDK